MSSSRTTETRLTVGELARASGVAPSAVRFYEAHGLIRGERTSGNQRRFRPPDACRVKVIRVAQRVGLTVAEIRESLSGLPEKPAPDDWGLLTDQLLQEATERIRQLSAALYDMSSGQALCDVPPIGDDPGAQRAGR